MKGTSGILKRFFDLNEALCERLAGHLPHTRLNIFETYELAVATLMSAPGVALVVDVGAGRVCPYAHHRTGGNPRIVAVDVTADAMRENEDADEKRVADAMQGLPFVAGEADIVTSRSVLEHVIDVERFVVEAARILRPGGYSVHLVSCRYAWFAILNRMLGERLSKRLLYALHPESRASGGLTAPYDRCYPSALTRLHRDHGYGRVVVTPGYGTNYTYFFAPLFLLTSVYEIAVKALRLRNLAANFVLVARKPALLSSR